MADERTLIASCLRSREAFEKIGPHLGEAEMSEHSKVLVEHIGSYYERDPEAKRVDPELLVGAVGRAMSNPKHAELFTRLIGDLAEIETSPPNVVADFLEVRTQLAGNKLASAIAAAKPMEQVAPLLEEYEKWVQAVELPTQVRELRNSFSVSDLVRTRVQPGGLVKILPKGLNERLDGGLLRGHHMIVFARPEIGKTLFVVNLMAGVLQQGLKVLYCGNEDPLNDVNERVISRLSGMTRAEIIDNPQEAEEKALAANYGNLYMAGLAPGTPREIEELAEETGADLLVVDQLRNLMTGKEENLTRRLEIAASAVRSIIQRHNMVGVSVTQAGDSATDRAYLDMGDVDSSNTGIPAQCDVLLGIGATEEDKQMNRRVISLPKNKAGNNHEGFPVMINPALSSIRSG